MNRFLSFLLIFLFCLPAWADPTADAVDLLRKQVAQLSTAVEQLNTAIQSQQQRIAMLEGVQAPPAAQPLPGSPMFGGVSAASASNLSALNPEIGVVGDFVGQLSESSSDAEGNDRISARELEIVFGHPIDPYSRLDATVSFSDFEAASLEEAYITHWGLPAEIKGKLGKFKPKAGKAVSIHRDSLDTVDEPLVVASYFGAEGLSKAGIEFSGFIPAPWTEVVHELTAGMMEGGVGEGGLLFGETRRRPTFYAHLNNFWDVSDTTNAEVGASYLAGSKDADVALEVNALGIDATLVHFFTPTNKFKWQNEAYFQDREESLIFNSDGTTTDFAGNPWGFYSLADYRLSPRFGIGGRFDFVEPIGLDPLAKVRNADTAWSGYLTFYQSEFSRWRLQFKHTDFAAGGDDNTVFLQGTVAIGVHKHALQ